MKTEKCQIVALVGGNRLELGTINSKGLAYIIAEHLAKTTYAKTADRITVEIRGYAEYSIFTKKSQEAIATC